MRNKLILSMLIAVSLSFTIVCSSNEEPVNVETKKDVQSKSKNSSCDFDGEVAEIHDIKIKITDTKIIQRGEEGNEYSENQYLLYGMKLQISQIRI